jgi:putative transposase
VKYAAIAHHVGRHSIRLMCRALQVSPAGFYAAQRRPPAARAIANALLTVEIATIHRESRATYGSPRIFEELKARAHRCSRKRVALLMRAAGLESKRPRPFRLTTQSDHRHPVAPNVLDRQFAIAKPNVTWVADITALLTGEGWLYLAVLLDLGSRRVIGWALDATPDRGLVSTALRRALAARTPGRGLLHHSDRGSVYASGEYRAQLDAHGITVSMSRIGNCWDNAVAESFFATLKTELVHDARWRTRAQATDAIADFIECWYNRQRRHSSLGYLSPVEYELKLMRRTA